MKADDSILALIPKGCRVNWNEKQKRFYVFKSSYYYSKEAKRSKEKRVQVGTVVDGVFTYAKSYLMSQELKSLKREAAETKTTVVEKTVNLLIPK